MAVTTTTRFGLTRWSAGTDPFSRAQMDDSHAQIEARGAIYGQGTLAARPAPGVEGRYYTVRGDSAANNGRTFYDDGAAWFEVGANTYNAAVRAGAANQVGLTVHGAASQTAALQEWKNSAGTVVASVAANGAVAFGAATLDATTVTTLTASGAVTLQSTLTVAGSVTFSGALTVNGTLKANTFRSTATRTQSGLPKTELNDDGTGRFDALIPPGHIMQSLRPTAADGWLLMQGQTVNVATYRDLWDALGQPGGAGATTFVIPDWRDRTAVGASATKALGTTGGATDASVTLTTNNLPGHTHDISHTHTVAHSHTIDHTHSFAHTHVIDVPAFSGNSGGTSIWHQHTGSTGGGGDHAHNYFAPSTDGGAVGGSTIYRSRVAAVTDNQGWHGHSFTTDASDPNHSHTIDHDHPAFTSDGASTTTTSGPSAANSGTSTPTTSAASTTTSGSAGSGAAFSVQDPYAAGHWVIKT